MNTMKSKARALTLGHLKEQLVKSKTNYEQLMEKYNLKLNDIDILERQYQTVIHSAKEELKNLFKKIQEQKAIYKNVRKKLNSLESRGEGKKRKRKTKNKKNKKIYRKKTRKMR